MGSGTLSLPLRPFARTGAAKVILIAILAPLVLIPAALAIRLGAYDSFVDNPLTGFGMWGTFAIHMWTRPSRREWMLTVAAALAMRGLYDLAAGERGYPGYLLIGMGAFLGVASLLAIAVGALGAASPRRAVCRRTLGVLALLTYLGFCLGYYLSLAELILPRKFDYYLYRFDGSLGFQPSFLAGRLLRRFPPLFLVEMTVYNCFGFWFSIVYAVHANSRAKYPVNVVKMLVVNALAGFSLYFICPAMGPKYAFPSFPNLAPAIQAAPILMKGAPNAIPSLHFGGALLLCWFCRPWKWLFRLMSLFAALTALATMGMGEHYLIDLVVAVPYALAILAFSSQVPERRLPLAAGAAMVLLWLFTLRLVHFYAPVAWTLALATVTVSFALERRLAAGVWKAIE
ncbi:MAG TPA: phosphatase PAP2 family protein [Bryobacteraceae bacterium]|nr:phosphatase PAP2 family protein [Bryobacteraceae bacterium]